MAGYYRSRSNRAARGNMRAAAQQRDVADFVIKVNHMLPIAIAGNNGTASASLWPILATSDQFKQLSRIFDQVSLKGARVTITPYTAVSFTGGSSTLVMNWDRNGNLDETGVWRTPTYNEIVSYSSTRMYNVGDLSVPRNYYMSIYPSSMNEKIEYMSTDFVRNY